MQQGRKVESDIWKPSRHGATWKAGRYRLLLTAGAQFGSKPQPLKLWFRDRCRNGDSRAQSNYNQLCLALM